MATGATNTYTTYLRSELHPATRQTYSQLRTIASETYRDIGRLAQEASNSTSAAFGDRRAAAGFRNLQGQASSAFGTIRRDAAQTAAAVSAMQARLATIRTTTLGPPVSTASFNTGGIRAGAAANDNLGAATRRVTAATEGATAAHLRNNRVMSSAVNESSRLGRGLTTLGTTLSVIQGPLGSLAGRVSAVTAAVTSLGTGTLVLAGAATAVAGFAAVANVYAEVESRLRPLYSTQEQVNAALRETGRIALSTRSALAPTADLYAKLTSAGRDFNLTSRQVSRVTETAAKAATLSGGNAATREAGLYQFSQGLASGRVGGDELRSVLENIPELARAIADGFKNADGSIGTTLGKLRELGSENLLTTVAVVDALGRSAAVVDAKFARMPKTISSARTEFVTSFTTMTGQIDQTVGVTSALANTISVAASNLRLLLALGGAAAARFVLPRLGGFISELTRATVLSRDLRRNLATQTATSIGRTGVGPSNASPVSFTPTGQALNQARRVESRAAGALADAQARVQAERSVIAITEQEIATTRAAAEADREKARAAQANARFEVAATTQRVEALRVEQAQILENRAAQQASVANFTRARPLVTAPRAGESDATRQNRVAAFDAQEKKAKEDLARTNLRVGATARQLAAAQNEQTAATERLTAATVTSTAAANASGRRGFAQLSLKQQQIVATVALAEAETAAAVATTNLGLAQRTTAAATAAFNATTGLLARGMTRVGGAIQTVINALGGGWVAALTLAAGAMIYLSGRTEAAIDSLNSFAGGQEELFKRLGLTTGALDKQADSVRKLALAQAQASLIEAKQERTAANRDLGGTLNTVAQRAGYTGNIPEGERRQILDRLGAMSQELRNGRVLSPQGQGYVADLASRRPELFQDTGIQGTIDKFLGRGASKAFGNESKVFGALAADAKVVDAINTLNEITVALSKPRGAATDAKPLTPAQIRAQAEQRATELDLVDPVANARDKRDDALKRIAENKKLTDKERVEESADVIGAYRREIAAIDKRNKAASDRSAAKAERERKKALREEELAAERAARATEKLTDTRARYDEAPRLVDRVRNDQRMFQSMVGDEISEVGSDGKTTRRKYTQAEANRDSAQAQAALLKPFNDMTRDMERQAQVQALMLQGRNAEADALQRSYQLLDTTGTLQEGQFRALVQAAETQENINAALADRQRIVSTLGGAVDEVRDATLTFLNELPTNSDKAARNLGRNLLSSFRTAGNRLLTDSLFGGVQKRIDDLISGKTALQNATTFTAQQATRTGGIIQRFGDVVGAVADRVEQTLQQVNAGVDGAIGEAPAPGLSAADIVPGRVNVIGDAAKDMASAAAAITAALGGAVAASAPTADDDGGETVVFAPRRRKPAQAPAEPQRQPTLREVYNETGRSIGEKIDNALGTKFAKNLGGKLGDALSGASKGSFASSIAGQLGLKQSAAGSAIGGAIGSFIPGVGPVIGGLVGGTIGGLFKKTKKSSSNITFDEFGNMQASANGSNSDTRQAAAGLGSNVGSQLQSIAEQLGGTIAGRLGVTIGTRKDKFVVDTTGQGRTKGSGVQSFKNEADAIEAALRDALSDGAIRGISAASQKILSSGQDLQRALSKALLIESIPKRLLAMTDPVRAAVNDLNEEFEKIIAALNEGGGTAQQYADAQKLYDLSRVKTIEEAQKSATSAIDAYLKDMLAGSNSPLNKATVYRNASTDLDALAKEVRAGNAVSEQDLLAAATKFQEASRAKNGSSQAFFSDFEMLQSLLIQARNNAGAAAGGNTTELPGSPFSSSKAVQDAIASSSNAGVRATQDQTAALLAKNDQLIAAIEKLGSGGGSSSGPSSMDNLAAFRSALT